jgi:ATP-dependent RNA helicase DeaD
MEKINEEKLLLFKDLNLSPNVLKAISEMGFEVPTPIQAQSIPPLLEGKDVIGQAQTGTGKTAAFGIPMIEAINPAQLEVQSIILCPTRELAIQVAEEIGHLSKYVKGIRILPIYGGQAIDRQFRALKSGVNIVIGTPGRVMDHLNRGTLKLNKVKILVLDEADEMLNMGFIDDIEEILKQVPSERQTVLFSATMPPPILKITKKYQSDPLIVKVTHKELTVSGVEQCYYEVRDREKLELLTRLLDINQPKLSLIFCNTKRGVDDLVEHLNARGFQSDALHGDMKQSQREKIMGRFRNSKIDILVATDVAARGIDVENIDAVFNYDFPQDEEYYVHRIGRTARAGKKGTSFSFVTPREIYRLKDIKKYTNAKIQRVNLPSVTDVETAKLNKFTSKIRETIRKGNLNEYLRKLENVLETQAVDSEGEEVTLIELSAALFKIAFESSSGVEKAAALKEKYLERMSSSSYSDRSSSDRSSSRRSSSRKTSSGRSSPGRSSSGRSSSGRTKRVFLNIGKNQNASPKDILGAICGETGIDSDMIGSIDMFENFTFVDIDKNAVEKVIDSMRGASIKGKKINIEIAKEGKR